MIICDNCEREMHYSEQVELETTVLCGACAEEHEEFGGPSDYDARMAERRQMGLSNF
jgi:hypothetical protein